MVYVPAGRAERCRISKKTIRSPHQDGPYYKTLHSTLPQVHRVIYVYHIVVRPPYVAWIGSLVTSMSQRFTRIHQGLDGELNDTDASLQFLPRVSDGQGGYISFGSRRRRLPTILCSSWSLISRLLIYPARGRYIIRSNELERAVRYNKEQVSESPTLPLTINDNYQSITRNSITNQTLLTEYNKL